ALGDRTLTLRHEQRAIAVPDQSATKVQLGIERRRLVKYHLHIFDTRLRLLDQAATRDGRVVQAPVTRLRVAPVDQMVRRERRIERDVEQPALVAGVDGGQTRNGFRELSIRADDPQLSGLLFGDQEPAAGKKGHTPGELQAL